MRKRRIAAIAAIAAIALIFGLTAAGCAEDASESTEITASIREYQQFDAPEVLISQEEFEAAGFQLGDSCDVAFSNGYTMADVPYFNGYYVKNGAPVIVAYPGSEHLSITHSNTGLWTEAGLRENDTVTVRLNEKGKYASIQEALEQKHSFERKDFPSDEAFCNFRTLSGGAIAEGRLFRGASPLESIGNRADFADDLLEEHGVRFLVDLADSPEDMGELLARKKSDSPYVTTLFTDGQGVSLGLSASYYSDAFRKELAIGLRQMLASGTRGPVYLFCSEGKDRTGFVCMLLEALAGASYREVLDDYMVSYQNYYGITADGTPEKYHAVADLYFSSLMEGLHGSADEDELSTTDLSADAAAYLASGGMSNAEIDALRAFIADS